MSTPIIFDIAAMVEFRPTREAFDPSELNEDTKNFEVSRATFTHFISDHHDTSTYAISDEEKIAFLSLWLLKCIFCWRSIQVAKKTMANQLHVGHKINLSQLILGSLYESLEESV